MKFIFPQNYNFKSKLFGFIDYSTLILNLVWGLFVFSIVYFFIPNITMKIGVFIILFLPFALLHAKKEHPVRSALHLHLFRLT